MRTIPFPRHRSALFFSIIAGALPLEAGELFEIPLRINMGGPTRTDSRGRTWLGDGPGPGDPLGIRVDDLSGVNTIENWGGAGGTGNFKGDSLRALGFDPDDPDDVAIFDTVRWDVGTDGIDFLLELPVPVGTYQVNLYFDEECCTNRHFKISLQDVIVDDDVSYLDYDPVSPALGKVGLLSFPGIEVGDEVLRIGLLPCPECPGATDTNAIIDAIEVVSGPGCDHRGLDFRCALDPAIGAVTGTWAASDEADGFQVLKGGVPLGGRLGWEVTGFTDPDPSTAGGPVTYTVLALLGDEVLGECSATLLTHACAAGLAGTVTTGDDVAVLAWTPSTPNLAATGYELRREGKAIATLPPTATSYEEKVSRRLTEYELVPLGAAGAVCGPLSCRVLAEAIPFEMPLRINMGGREIEDSHGDIWLGDGPGAGDPLGIRPDDRGGALTVENWGKQPATPYFLPDCLTALGFDAASEADAAIFDTIRYDGAGDSYPFALEIPVPLGVYEVRLSFIEECCPARHFRVEIQGDIVEDDLSYEDFAVDPTFPSLGWAGRLIFDDISVADGLLRIRLLPCDPCPAGSVVEPLVSAIEAERFADLPLAVERRLSSRSFADGEDVEVSLDVRSSVAADIEISEALTEGATAAAASDGGAIGAGVISWSLKGVTAKTVTYTVVPSTCGIAPSFPGSTWKSGARTGPVGGAARIVRRMAQEADLGPWSLTDLKGEEGGIEVSGPHGIVLAATGLGTRLADDGVRFAHFPATGDFDLVARLDCFDDPAGLGGAGLMVRSGLEPWSAMAWFHVVSGTAPGTRLLKGMWRQATSKTRNARVLNLVARDVPSLPHYLRLVRSEGKISFSRSADGIDWSVVFTGDISAAGIDLGPDTLAGLAVSGGGSPSCASFSSVTGPAFPPGAGEARFRRTDADATGVVDLADAISTLRYLFLAGETPSCLDAADADDSGVIDLADPIFTLRYLFLAGERPPAPGPESCGSDASPSALAPCVYEAKCD